MRFSLASLAALAFSVVSVSAQTADFTDAYKPAKGEEIPAGKTYKVEWRLPATAAKGPISIILVGGANQGSQQVLKTLESGYDNTKLFYDWAVDASLGALAVYGLKFELESDKTIFQWSNNFQIVGGGSGGSNTTTSSSSSSASPSSTKTPSTMSTSTTTSVQTSGTTTVTPPTTTPPTSGGPSSASSSGSIVTSPTTSGNGTRPTTVPPSAAAGFSASGPLALVAGLAALMLVL